MRFLLPLAARTARLFTVLIFLSFSVLLLPTEPLAKSFSEIELTGTFTLNPAYSFNQPTLAPFGTFGEMTLVDATGSFSHLMHHGESLLMEPASVLSPDFFETHDSKPLAGQMLWSIGPYTIDTTWTSITGADFVGRNVSGAFDLSGRQFDHNGHARTLGSWAFTAPPYDITHFTEPVTGPITLTIRETHTTGKLTPASLTTRVAFTTDAADRSALATPGALSVDTVVPEPTSLLLLGSALVLLAGVRSFRLTN